MANGRQIILGPNVHTFGTLGWAGTWGSVKSAKISDTCDQVTFDDGKGDPEAVLWHNERLECDLTVLFKSSSVIPQRGDQIDLPDLTVEVDDGNGPQTVPLKANVKDIEKQWEQGGFKMYSIKAFHWKSIGNVVATIVTDPA